jgi:hypothetical protein
VSEAALQVTVALAPPLQRACRSDSVAADVAAAVARPLADLGVPLHPDVELVTRVAERPLGISISGTPLAVAPRILTTAWTAIAPAPLRTLPTDDATDWIGRLATSSAPPSLVNAFVARAVQGAIEAQPECLASDGLFRAYAGDDAPPGLALLLRALLSRGIAIADREIILGRLAAANELGSRIDEMAEGLAARLRDPVVTILVAPADADAYGLDTDDRRHAPVDAVPGTRDAAMLDAIADALHAGAGLAMPMFELRLSDDLDAGMIAIRINSLVCLPRPGLRRDEVLVASTTDILDATSASYELVAGLTGVTEMPVVDAATGEILAEAGFSTDDARTLALKVAYESVVDRAARILDLEEVEAKLGALAAELPSLADAVFARLAPTDVAALLRALVAEQVPVANLPEILERALDFDAVKADAAEVLVLDDRVTISADDGTDAATYRDGLVEHVRRGVRRLLVARASGGAGTLAVLQLDGEIEDRAAALDPETDHLEVERIRAAVARAVAPVAELQPVLGTRRGGRAAVRAVIASELPDLPVLDDREIDGTADTRVVGRVELGA